MARHGHQALRLRAPADVVARAVVDTLAAVGGGVSLEGAERGHVAEYPAAGSRSTLCLWTCMSSSSRISTAGCAGGSRRCPALITCVATLDEARDLVRDALDEWLAALTNEERAATSPARR
jgi:hypothetical protein